MTSVLIVEDEAIVAADLAHKLRHLGYEVCGIAARGEQAVAQARQYRPQVVLMDIRLAGSMDGIEAAEQIRRECNLPVIYLTAHSDRRTLQRAKVTQPFGYILKPFEERELQTHIEMAVYKHQAEQKLRASEERLRQLNAELEQRVLERTARLRALATELTQTEERERRRIAQILHDHLQQLLVATRLNLETATTCFDQAAARESLEKALHLVDESTAVSRSLSHELSPPIIHQAGLPEAFRWLGGWMKEKHGLRVQVHALAGAPPLPDDIKLLLFNSTRELLFNVVKHAGVKQARVRLTTTPGRQVTVVVSDPGKGFPQSASAQPALNGLGLFSIRERIESLGGQLEIDSRPNRGSRVRLSLPL